MTESQKPARSEQTRVGQPFNPFRLFTGIFIPEALVRSELVSPGAKMAYGRLVRYAGQDGRCFPTVAKLAGEIGVGKRQAQKYLGELEREKLIRRRSRFAGPAQTSNDIEFLWHSLFGEGVNFRSGEGVNDSSPGGVNDRSPKESQIQESHPEESHNGDLDYPPTNRKKRDSRLDSAFAGAGPRQYPRLRETLADYMVPAENEERVCPSDRQVVDVLNAAAGATEEEVVNACDTCTTSAGSGLARNTGPDISVGSRPWLLTISRRSTTGSS